MLCCVGEGYLIQGEFSKGLLNGQGIMKLKDGRSYDGQVRYVC